MEFVTVNGYMGEGVLSEWATSIGNKVPVCIWGPPGYLAQVCVVYLSYAYFIVAGGMGKLGDRWAGAGNRGEGHASDPSAQW
jgi:hypothetical protein